MAQTVRHLMTEKPVALQDDTTLAPAARAMRDHDIGNVIVLQRDQIRGITIRGVAEEFDPSRHRR